MPAGKGRVSEGTEALRLPTSDPVVVFAKWCKGCGICVEFCPTKALAVGRDDRPVLADADRCTSCGMCEIRCPDFGITVTHRKRG